MTVNREYYSSKIGVLFAGRDVAVLTLVLFTMLAFPSTSLRADENSQKVAIATKLVQAQRLDEAEVVLWEVLTRHPDDAEALNMLGNIRLQQKRFAESETLLRRAMALSPKLLPAYVNLARLFDAENETAKEIAVLLDASRLAPSDAEVNCDLAAAYLKQNDYPRALDALQRIPIARRPDSAFPLLATTYLGLDRIADVRSLAPAISARAAKDPQLPVQFAEVLLDFGLTNQALSILETAQKQQRPSAELFSALGRAHKRKGEVALAQKDFRLALELNPNSFSAQQSLAHLLADQGQWEKSLDILRRARAANPNSPDVLRELAATSLHGGHASDAVEAAHDLVKLRPDDADALYLLGVAQLQDGKSEEARATLESYTKLRPLDALAFLALAMVDDRSRDFPAAEADLQQSIKLDPTKVEPYYQLGMVFREQGDNSAAIAQLEKAIAVNNQYAPAQAVLGTLYLGQQEYGKAQEHLTRAVALAPDIADTHYQLGLLFVRLNQRDRAQREMEEFHKLQEKAHSGTTPPGERPATSPAPYPPS